jgi:pyruvate kinase
VHSNSIVDSVSSSVVHNAEDVRATLIVALTETGSTARMIARYKPQQPIIVVTRHPHVVRQSQIVFGCYPLLMNTFTGSTQLSNTIGAKLLAAKVATKGDRIVLTAGVPFGKAGSTNMLMILTI